MKIVAMEMYLYGGMDYNVWISDCFRFRVYPNFTYY